MSCNFSKENLEAFALSLLEGDEKASVATHIAGCPECRSFVLKRRETVQLLSNAFTDDPPDWLVQKTMAVLSHRAAAPWYKRILLPASVCTAAAALVAALFLLPGMQTGRAHFLKNGIVHTVTLSENTSEHRPGRPVQKSVQESAALYDTYLTDETGDAEENIRSDAPPDTDVRAVLGLIFRNPAADRSIYTSLGVHEEIAALLL